MRKELKEHTQKKKGGLLSQDVGGTPSEQPEKKKNAEEQEAAQQASSQLHSLRLALQQEQAKNEMMRANMEKEMEAQRIAAQEAQLRNEKMIQSLLQKQQQDVIPEHKAVVKCDCGAEAEKLKVKKEGPRKGRFFWKCVQRRCEFFKWDDPQHADSILGSFSMVSSLERGTSEASAPASRRRSKSPRRSLTDTAGGQAITIADSEED
eukprot:s391_g28.t1